MKIIILKLSILEVHPFYQEIEKIDFSHNLMELFNMPPLKLLKGKCIQLLLKKFGLWEF